MRSQGHSSEYQFSLIVPLYKSEDCVDNLISRLEDLHFSSPWQAVFVDDGSPDQTYERIRERLKHSSLAAILISHTRNFGEHQAVLTGYRHAQGKFLINIDDDLQNPPEEALRLLDYAEANSLDVVYGNYIEKKHSSFRNLGSFFANITARFLLDLPATFYLSSFRCVNRDIAEKITTNHSPYIYIDGLLSQSTSRIGSIDVRHESRSTGSSGYNLRRLVRLWLVILTSFSLMPLRLATFLGFTSAVLGAACILYIVIRAFFGIVEITGWPSVISSILFLAVYSACCSACLVNMLEGFISRSVANHSLR